LPDNDKTVVPTPSNTPSKRSRTVGIIATLVGILACVIALIGVISTDMDMLYLLLFAGGMLVTVLGLRRMRSARAN